MAEFHKNTANMKSFISLCLVVICTVVLAAQQSQAKKGCNAYGHACYGGHGKRSLGPFVANGVSVGNPVGSEPVDLHADAILLPNEAAYAPDGDFDAYPRYRLIKIMKSWMDAQQQRRPTERLGDLDYAPISAESFNHLGNNVN